MACLTILIAAVTWQHIMLFSIVLFLFFSNAIVILISHCLMPDYLTKQWPFLFIHGVMLYSNIQYNTVHIIQEWVQTERVKLKGYI